MDIVYVLGSAVAIAGIVILHLCNRRLESECDGWKAECGRLKAERRCLVASWTTARSIMPQLSMDPKAIKCGDDLMVVRRRIIYEFRAAPASGAPFTRGVTFLDGKLLCVSVVDLPFISVEVIGLDPIHDEVRVLDTREWGFKVVSREMATAIYAHNQPKDDSGAADAV